MLERLKKRLERATLLSDIRIKRSLGVFYVDVDELTKSKEVKEDSKRLKDLWDKYVDENGNSRAKIPTK